MFDCEVFRSVNLDRTIQKTEKVLPIFVPTISFTDLKKFRHRATFHCRFQKCRYNRNKFSGGRAGKKRLQLFSCVIEPEDEFFG